MVDNVVLNSGSGGDTVAADDVAGVKYQVVKLAVGADGAASLVADANPIPVSDAGGSLTVDGTVELGATALAALETITVASVTAPLAAGDNNIGNVDIVTMPDVTLAAGTNTNEVVGDAAHDAAVAGNPLLMGAAASTAVPTAVSADADAVRLWASRNGALNTILRDSTGDSAMDDTNNALRVNVVAGGAAGGTSVTDDAAFTAASGAVTPIGGFVTSDAVDSGDVGAVAMTTARELKVNISSGGVPGQVDDAAFTPATGEGVMIMALADETTPDSVDEGDGGALRMTLARALHINVRDDAGDSCMDGTNNALRVNIVAGAGSGGTAMTDDAAFTPATTSVTPIAGILDDTTPDSVDEGDAGAVRMSANRNLYVRIRDNAGNERGLNIDAAGALTANLAAGTNNIGDVDVLTLPALPAGTNNIGDVDVASIAAGTNNIGNVGLIGRTTGGLSIHRSLDIDESEEEVKATAGTLYSIHAVNMTATTVYLKFYNATAANVTVGTTTPVLTFPVPSQGDTLGAGFVHNIPQGYAFGTAISVACTTGLADADTGAPAANACVINLGYT